MVIKKGRILVVDDEPLVLEIFQTFLSKQGYDVFVASNSKEALKRIEKVYFDAIVTDIILDEIDGFDIIEIARRKNSMIAAILVTGAPEQKHINKAKNLGACYLTKPISFDVLLKSLETAISETKNAGLNQQEAK